MAWLRIDDRVRTHPKIAVAGPAAAWLWFCGICYCREHLTDGFIPKAAVVSLAMNLASPWKHAARLVEVRLWEDVVGGYQVHDFLDWNPSKADVEANREWGTQRKSLYRDKDMTAMVRERDGDRCRYCGRTVNFNDRRGPAGGQLDHVEPRGPNTLDNIVVSCRECNCKKHSRSPNEAGMNLIGTSPNYQTGTSSNLVNSHARMRDRAGDAGLGSLSGSGSGDLSDPEESTRETAIEPRWSRDGRSAGLAANTHLRCYPSAACARGVCVPGWLATEWRQQYGDDTAMADVEIAEVITTALAALPPSGPIGDEPKVFWRAVWKAAHGSQAPASGAARSKGQLTLDAARRFVLGRMHANGVAL